jgi:flagellar M-ring protein FliF
MNGVGEQADRLMRNLLGLGPRRLAALAIIGVTIFAVVILGGVYLSRPQLDVLYSGLDREDVTRIGAALNEAGIKFDVNSDGTAVMVSYGQTAAARMLLAEKGLPQSANAGYELFDQMGSFGLTSFMQEVTRVRVLEGEIARTIQSLNGVKAARVHIVVADEGSFRREQRPPSASVVIRTEAPEDATTAQSIRHLVAAAVPGMTPNEVTVLNTDGVLLASGDDTATAVPGRLMNLEQSVGEDIRNKVRESLTPYLGLGNFQVSVTARLNTDKKQITETIYDPESRVERSVHVVKENESSNNSTQSATTSVEQNLPEESRGPEGAESSSSSNDRREETTNYELSSKTVNTVSDGFAVQNLSIAVLVNRAQIPGGVDATEEQLQQKLSEIEELVATAADLRTDRGDQIKVLAVDFAGGSQDLEPVPAVGMTELLVRQLGTIINAATILVVALLLIWFGLRPATRAILARPAGIPAQETPALTAGSGEPALALEDQHAAAGLAEAGEGSLIDDLTVQFKRSPTKRLEQMVHFNDEQSAAILKRWIHEGART